MARREHLLVERCMASVQRQRYDGIIDHVIISDLNVGVPDRVAARVPQSGHRPYRVIEINDTWRNPLTMRCTGSFPWRHGCFMAHGEFVAFLGDDDEFLEHHIEMAVSTMETEQTTFSLSQVAFYGHGRYALTIGDESFALGHMDATGLVCRRENLRVANWDIAPLEEPDFNAGDYRMVRDWQAAGLRGSFIPQITANHHDGWLVNYS
jgi:hypothetical protein